MSITATTMEQVQVAAPPEPQKASLLLLLCALLKPPGADTLTICDASVACFPFSLDKMMADAVLWSN